MINDTDIPQVEYWLALDIDETLSSTVGYLMSQLQIRFWNPENLSVEDMLQKYRYSRNVPYRQTDEAKDRLAKEIQSNAMQEVVNLHPWAYESVLKITESLPISCYITTRPETVRQWSINRLKAHDFPEAPLIMKPINIEKKDGNERKARVLEHLSETVVWIVDDNPWLIDHLDDTYPGVVFMYNNESKKEEHIDKKNYIPCPTWDTVVQEVKEYFW